MNNKLQNILDSMHILQASYPEDACIVVIDTERAIGYLPGKTVSLPGIQVGTPISTYEKTVTVKALREKRRIIETRGEEIFGFPYVSTSVPIYDNNEVIGVISSIVTNYKMVRKLETLKKGSEDLVNIINDAESISDYFYSSMKKMTENVRILSDESNLMIEQLNNTYSIVDFIKQVSNKTNILSFNALIEAARAGEHGQGFTVVANEMKKMSGDNNDSAKRIHIQLDDLQKSLKDINENIQKMLKTTDDYETRVLDLKNTIDLIGKTAETFAKASEEE